MDRLGLSYGQVWRILRKVLKWRAYSTHLVQILSPANKESRVAACTFWLNFTAEQFERVLCSDEKWFVLHQAPNRKNDVIWSPYSPDLNPLDFSFWSQAMAHVVRCEPPTLQELKEVVEDFAINFNPEKARAMTIDQAYLQKGGALH